MDGMALQRTIGYDFRNEKHLVRAMTRRAYAEENRKRNTIPEHHEALSTLGDAVLKVILVEMLMEKGFHTKGCITEAKSELESEEGLEQIAEDLRLGDHIILGKGEEKQHANKESRVLAETLEALIGAVFLDSGYQTTRGLIQRWFQEDFQKVCEKREYQECMSR